jgi:hypothetical protein
MYLQRNFRVQLDAIRFIKLVQNTSHAAKSGQLSVGESANSTLHK